MSLKTTLPGRVKQANTRLVVLVGEWRGVPVTPLPVIVVMFVLIEFAALAGSISRKRSITHAVNYLYEATATLNRAISATA